MRYCASLIRAIAYSATANHNRIGVACHVVIATTIGIKSVRLTGGEPTVRKGLVDLVRNIAAMPEIENVSMTTNGVLLPRMAADLKAAGLSRVNLSLDTLDAEKFHKITRCGSLDDALRGIDAALESGFNPVKINAVALRSLADGFLDFAKLSIDRPLHVRFIEHMPIGDVSEVDGISWGKDGVISCEEVFNIINEGARAQGLSELVPAGEDKPIGWGPAGTIISGTAGHGGLYQPALAPLLQQVQPPAPDGRRQALRPCLFSDVEYDLRTALREEHRGRPACRVPAGPWCEAR